MEEIQAIHNSIYSTLRENTNLRKYVTNIYDYLPKQVSTPYVKLHVVNYKNVHMLSNFAIKARFSCDVYTYHIDSMFNIIKHINLILKDIKYLDIVENNCVINQYDEILHSVINFDVFFKGVSNEKITIEN